jgi:outer membrane protein
MFRVPAILLAGALLAAPIVSAPPAHAQAAVQNVLVVDLDQVVARSVAGRDVQSKLQGIRNQITGELQAEANGLQNDQKALGPRFQGKSPQQALEELQKDQNLAKQYQSYQQRLQAAVEKENLRNQELQVTRDRAINQVLQAADPIVQELLTQRGALIVLERGSVYKMQPAVDITNDVIARLDQRLKTVSVVKADLMAEMRAAQAKQGQPAQPR